MRLPRKILAQFQEHGRRGGKARAESLSSGDRIAIARQAAIRRWIRARFGGPSFEELGLPGGAMIDRGLADLAAGRETPDSLVVALAAPRLRREAVPMPATTCIDADWRLYRRMEEDHGALAHSRYLARLRLVESFANACRFARTDRGGHAR